MPRTKEQNDIVKAERKKSILDSSLLLYSLYGNKITIDQISDKSKCSHGIVYHYFKNVDEIIETLLSSDELKTFKSDLFALLDEDNLMESITVFIKRLTSLKNVNEIAMAHILLKEEDKQSLKEKLSSFINKGQSERLFVPGESSDIIAVLFSFLNGIYLESLINKKANLKAISVDNILNIVIRH